MRRKRQKAMLSQKSKLSFLGDDDDNDQREEGDQQPRTRHASPGTNGVHALESRKGNEEGGTDTPRLGKDPTVATEFLPDRNREAVR